MDINLFFKFVNVNFINNFIYLWKVKCDLIKICGDWILKVMECEYGFNISSGEL